MKDLARRVWLATGAAVALFAIYETLKSLLFPGMSLTVSHVVTVIVVGILSYFISNNALNRYVVLLSEKERETAKTEEINRLLSGVLATMREAVLIVNSDMRIVLHNRAARKLVKLPDPEQSELESDGRARRHLGPASRRGAPDNRYS
jgi:PAS domain-containing protein